MLVVDFVLETDSYFESIEKHFLFFAVPLIVDLGVAHSSPALLVHLIEILSSFRLKELPFYMLFHVKEMLILQLDGLYLSIM